MLAKYRDKTKPIKSFKRPLLLQERAIIIISFQSQTIPSNNLFKENRILFLFSTFFKENILIISLLSRSINNPY